MNSKKSLKAKKAGKPVAAGKAKTKAAAKANRFLFSIPSLHTHDHDYEHLVIAPNKDDACRLLAEHRVTEKRPDLEGDARAKLVAMVTEGYMERDVSQIEPRKEKAGVVAINHHKLGVASPSLN
jgi:hypothetical protein